MREIKFRVYDVGTKHFFYWGVTDCFPMCLTKEYIKENIQLFTGLKDKNGVEIYEGDIVKVWDNYKQVYSSKKESIDDIVIPTIQVVEFWEYGFFAGDFGVGKFEIEVIGNKFDNPELLERSKDRK